MMMAASECIVGDWTTCLLLAILCWVIHFSCLTVDAIYLEHMLMSLVSFDGNTHGIINPPFYKAIRSTYSRRCFF